MIYFVLFGSAMHLGDYMENKQLYLGPSAAVITRRECWGAFAICVLSLFSIVAIYQIYKYNRAEPSCTLCIMITSSEVGFCVALSSITDNAGHRS